MNPVPSSRAFYSHHHHCPSSSPTTTLSLLSHPSKPAPGLEPTHIVQCCLAVLLKLALLLAPESILLICILLICPPPPIPLSQSSSSSWSCTCPPQTPPSALSTLLPIFNKFTHVCFLGLCLFTKMVGMMLLHHVDVPCLTYTILPRLIFILAM